jgi:hypothetical protein
MTSRAQRSNLLGAQLAVRVRMRSIRAGSVIWFILAAACAEATTPTQVVVLVDADAEVRSAASAVQLNVTNDSGKSSFDDEATELHWPLKLVLAPEKGVRNPVYRVRATALDPEGRAIAYVALRSGFIANEARFVTLRLRSGCSTSESTVRVPASRLGATGTSAYAVEACEKARPTVEDDDASVPSDGEPSDGSKPSDPPPAAQGGDAMPIDPGTCDDGFRPAANGCEDVDECSMDPCGDHGVCENLPGTYRCTCESGYARQGELCVASNACGSDNAGCEERCSIVDATPRCHCDDGGWLKPDGKSCWRWHTPAAIETFTPGGASDVQLAVNSLGNALAAWTQSDGARTHVASNAFTNGAWRAAAYVSSDSRSDSHSPRITLDASGNGFAIWDERPNPGEMSPGSARWSADRGWTDVRFGEPRQTGPWVLYGPQFGGSPDGHAMEVRGYAAGRGAGLPAVRYDLKTGVASAAVELEWDPAPTGPVGFTEPFTALGPGGIAFTVFGHSHPQGSGTRAWANISTPANPRGAATALDGVQAEGGDASAPSIAVDATGNAVAVWYRHEVTRFVVLANRYVMGLGWTGEAELQTAPAPMSGTIYENPPWWQLAHAAVFDAAGHSCAAWIHTESERDDVWASCYSGSAWSEAKRIDVEGAGDSIAPKLAADGLGNVIAIWTRSDGKTKHVYTNRSVKDLGWSVAKRLDTSGTDAEGPAIGFDAAGNGFAIWSQFDAGATHAVASRFD